MTEESFGSYAKGFKKEILTYVDLKLEYTKLVTYEKVAKVSAVSMSFLVIIFFAFFAFFFLSFAVGYYLGAITGSVSLGFGIIAIIYLILLIAVIALRKKYFEKAIIEKVIEVLTDDDETSKTQ